MTKQLLSLAGILWAVSCSDPAQEPYRPGTGGGGSGTEQQEAVSWHERAYETYGAVDRLYRIGSGATAGLYNENYPKGNGDGAASFLWPFDGLVSGVAALNRLGYEVGYTGLVEKYERYWRASGAVAVGGYGSATDGTSGGGDRFFDDNSIVGLNLVEAYVQTGDSRYLERCARIVRFLQSGEDEVFGGGLWWNESYKYVVGNENSCKPCCGNAYAIWFLMSYYEVCPESGRAEVLAFARRLYAWTRQHLCDPEDGVYWDGMYADGTVNPRKWTYNVGAMVAAGVRLYKATGIQSYLDEAKTSAEGAYNYFVRSRNGLALAYPTNDPWFTIKLVHAFIELEPYYERCTSFLSTFISFAEYAWEHGRMENGLFYEDWTGQNINPDRDKSLLMQDAAIESLALIALYKEEHHE